ncbi:hypothetical protein DsansV1_C03g0029001 [Dioscorea sansibarensis]
MLLCDGNFKKPNPLDLFSKLVHGLFNRTIPTITEKHALTKAALKRVALPPETNPISTTVLNSQMKLNINSINSAQ